MAALVLLPAKPWLKGAAIGLVLTIKPQLLFFAPLVYLARRDWVLLRWLVIGASASVALSLALFGTDAWWDWLASLTDFPRVVTARNLWWVTVTPSGTAMRFGINPWPAWIIAVGLAVVISLKSRGDPLFLAALSSLIASPYAVTHDLAVIVPFCLTMMERDKAPSAALIYAGWTAPIGLICMALEKARQARNIC